MMRLLKMISIKPSLHLDRGLFCAWRCFISNSENFGSMPDVGGQASSCPHVLRTNTGDVGCLFAWSMAWAFRRNGFGLAALLLFGALYGC